MTNYFGLILVLCFSLRLSNALSTFKPARPPAIPLAVKSPYLSTWLDAGNSGPNSGNLVGQWPVHWSDQTTGWAGLVRVDGTPYRWMGNPLTTSNISNVDQISFEYTSTRSIFTMNVGNKVQMNIMFLSPVNPKDMKRQSLTFSYLDVAVASLDGKSHNVQIYADITAEWASGEKDAIAQWNYECTGDVAYHKVWRQTQITFDENQKPDGNGMANWGNVYWATRLVAGLTRQSGQDSVVRGAFVKSGQLNGTSDSRYRAINDAWPVFAFAKDLGDVNATSSHTLFSIGLLQKPAVQFLGAKGLEVLPSLWASYFDSEGNALKFFHDDYSGQTGLSTEMDSQVQSDSMRAGGQDYATITTLSVRQAFGATQLVGATKAASDPPASRGNLLFMKEISSNGNTQTVDVIFPLHPILLYFNPTLLKLTLDPLFENQESGHYPNMYSMHDLGAHYPNATGHEDGKDEEMPVEECGNMLIMTLAYAQRTEDYDYLKQHYQKLSQWTTFLINDTLIPANQLSTDDFAGRLQNQTNLALKGIIGIQAMSEIARLAGNSTDAKQLSSIAHDYIDKWQKYGIAYEESPPHTTLNYGDNKTNGLLYNLWCDKELGLGLVPQSVYDMQSNFYPTQKRKFGVPLDTRHNWTKADWEMWAAAASSSMTRDMFIRDLANWINVTPTNRPLPDLFDTDTGGFTGITFTARPVMGGVFALLVNPPDPKVLASSS